MACTGYITELDNGEWRQQPDYVKALAVFRRLVNEYKKGETRYYDQALQQIDNIIKPSVGVLASNIFLPDSEIQLNLSWRNVKRVDLDLYKVDLPRDVRFTDKDQNSGSWAGRIDVAGREPIRAWSKETKDNGTFNPSQEPWHFERSLP